MSAQATAVGQPSTSAKKTRKRILTGDRPTGKLHVGNYVGTLANRVKLQDSYDTFLLVADHHMLTTRLDRLSEIEQNIRDDVIDNLAVGVDPEKVNYFLQSLVPQIPELHLLFSMLISVPRVQRIPTLKDQLRDHGLAQPTYGLLGYPVLQAADILIVKGDLVPVGRDQESHVELTREIARRFNELFAPSSRPSLASSTRSSPRAASARRAKRRRRSTRCARPCDSTTSGARPGGAAALRARALRRGRDAPLAALAARSAEAVPPASGRAKPAAGHGRPRLGVRSAGTDLRRRAARAPRAHSRAAARTSVGPPRRRAVSAGECGGGRARDGGSRGLRPRRRRRRSSVGPRCRRSRPVPQGPYRSDRRG